MEMDFSDLNWFDIAVISTVFISTVFAFFRGFIKAFFSLVTWVGASLVSIFSFPYASQFLSSHVQGEKLVMAASTVGVFLISFIVIAIITSKIVVVLRRQRGGVIDRTLGFGFGLGRGVLIVCAVFFSINMTSKMLQLGEAGKAGPAWFVEAKTYNSLKIVTSAGEALLPEGVTEEFISYLDKMKSLSTEMVESQLGISSRGIL